LTLAALLGVELAPADVERAEILLAEWLDTARSYWHGLEVPASRFVPYVGARLPGERSAADELGALNLCDLYLCAACAAGDEAAIELFDRTYSGEIERALAHLDGSGGDLTDEIKQVVREKLFVAEPGAEPRITSYAGRGPLGRWVWVMATREALMLLRARTRRRETALDPAHFGLADDAADTELEYFKREYRAEFRRAFAEAMAALSSKHRNLLYYHFVRRLTIDQIGSIYRVHRVTAFRWLRAARQAVVDGTRGNLASRLELSASEIDSIVRLVQSRLDISVERMLGD
jgi:RNA polymerase sigma-70 factor (ECF subfamily)